MMFWFNECMFLLLCVDFFVGSGGGGAERTKFSPVFETAQRLDLISAGACGLM